jgi:uncharacterized protein YdgA (DUF945 family)
MKKTLTLALVIAGLGVGYTAASWHFGKQTEARLINYYDKALETTPYVTLVERDYQRGIFASDETLTVELFSNFKDTELDTHSENPPAADNPLRLVIKTHIQHGPFPGLSTFAAAKTTSEIQLSEKIKQDVAQVLGDKSPLTQQTTILFDGSGQATFSSPKFEFTLPEPQEKGNQEKKTLLTWEGFQGDLNFSPDLKHFTMKAQAPALTLSDGDGFRITLSDIRTESDQEQIFDDIAYLYSGSQRMSVAEMALVIPESGDDPFVIKRFSYDLDLPKNGDFVDLVEHLGFESLQIGKDSIGPIHFDYSLKHLHARTIAELTQAFMGLYSDPDMLNGNGVAYLEKLIPQLMQHAETLLDNAPEFHINRLSFANAKGEANLKGRVKFNGLKLQEILVNPTMILPKLEASGEMQLEEEMVLELLRNPPGKEKMELANLSPEELEAQSRMISAQFQEQVAMFTKLGYITREGSLLKTHAEFKAGQLLVNGKPFMLLPSQQPPPLQDEAAIQ